MNVNALSMLFGAVIGLSLSLTGGGGAIFAVPLLVYGLGAEAQQAIAVSLAAVGGTAAFGFLQRLRRHQVELRTGMYFVGAGVLAAPAGTWMAQRMPHKLLLGLFALMMIPIATLMWRRAGHSDPPVSVCDRDESGEIPVTLRCAVMLIAVGLAAGLLTGLFGIGGGFILVPAFVVLTGMGMPRAIGTSLMVVATVSAVSIVSRLAAGQIFPFPLTLWFIAGGIAGFLAGTRFGRLLPGPALQKSFAIAIFGVAGFMLWKTARGF